MYVFTCLTLCVIQASSSTKRKRRSKEEIEKEKAEKAKRAEEKKKAKEEADKAAADKKLKRLADQAKKADDKKKRDEIKKQADDYIKTLAHDQQREARTKYEELLEIESSQADNVADKEKSPAPEVSITAEGSRDKSKSKSPNVGEERRPSYHTVSEDGGNVVDYDMRDYGREKSPPGKAAKESPPTGEHVPSSQIKKGIHDQINAMIRQQEGTENVSFDKEVNNASNVSFTTSSFLYRLTTSLTLQILLPLTRRE